MADVFWAGVFISFLAPSQEKLYIFSDYAFARKSGTLFSKII